MPYIPNRRPKPKSPQNNVMAISKTLKVVNDRIDQTVLFIFIVLLFILLVTNFLLFYIYNLVYLSESNLFYVQGTYKLFLLP